jgi:hypothetical protein
VITTKGTGKRDGGHVLGILLDSLEGRQSNAMPVRREPRKCGKDRNFAAVLANARPT